MDKFKGIAKGGWQPSGDRPIHRETWKSDLKGMATGKKKDPYEEARNHQSTPLAALKDPASFAPPPKHNAYYGNTGPPSITSSSSQGGLGTVVSTPSRQAYRQEQQKQEQEEARPPPGPYRTDTTGLRTDNLPMPPVRRTDSPVSAVSPGVTPARSRPIPPPRTTASPANKAPPILPPRQTETPSEYTPAPPPTYGEAVSSQQAYNISASTQGSINRLAQAGVTMPALGIGTATRQPESTSNQGQQNQLSELQQRFSRMNPNAASEPSGSSQLGNSWRPTPSGVQNVSTALSGRLSSAPLPSSSTLSNIGKKPAPPPPPPKKSGLANGNTGQPPPLPLSSKPRPS